MQRLPRTFIVGTGLLLVLGFLGTPLAGASVRDASSTSSIPSAKKLIASSEKAMLAKNSLHFTIDVVDEKTKEAETINADVGKKIGSEALATGSASAKLRVTSDGAYIAGNAGGLEDFFGMPSTDVSKVGSKWISVKSSASQYKSLQESVTISPFLTSLFPTAKSIDVTKSKEGGLAVYVLHWTTKSSGTTTERVLDILSTGTPLPIEGVGMDEAKTGTILQTITVGKWNENLSVATPATSDTIAFTSLAS
jgi:hypothetical protein